MKSCINLEITEKFHLNSKEGIDLLLRLIQSQYLHVEYQVFANLEFKYITLSYNKGFKVKVEMSGYFPVTTLYNDRSEAISYLMYIST